MTAEHTVPQSAALYSTTSPACSPSLITEALAAAYDIAADVQRQVASERDQVVLLSDATRQWVVKISRAGETGANLDLEAAAADWAAAADPGLPVSAPLPARDGARHIQIADPASGTTHFMRVYARLPGSGSADGIVITPEMVGSYGAVAGRTARALRGFFHPALSRTSLWHVANRTQTRALSRYIDDPVMRTLVEDAFAGFEERVAPRWAGLRAQAVHCDLTLDNVLFDEQGQVSAIIDFGDLTSTTLVEDLSAVIAEMAPTFTGESLFVMVRRLLDGYRSESPLEPAELAVLGDTAALRAAIILCISNWRSATSGVHDDYLDNWDAAALNILREFAAVGHREVTRRLGGPVPAPDTAALRARRTAVFGTALAGLTYREPLHLERGRGALLYDVAGREYLDAYNNVPVVGHAHPRVAEAVAAQVRLLQTNLRYLHPRAIELAERIVDTMPAGLDTVLFVNSGSEAVDVAWRLCTAATGNTGGLVTRFAYHGVTTAATALSPEEWRGGWRPDHIEVFEPPAGARPDIADLRGAIDRLGSAGRRPAMVIVDSLYTSDGILDPGPTYHRDLVAAAHTAGALVVADEVQAGFGRAGGQLWSFTDAGIVPDIVTLGKPMGNGFPMAAVIARGDLVSELGERAEFFSTFAGGPVAAVAGLAVLDVISDEGLLDRSAAMGALLRQQLTSLLEGHPAVRAVRGRGLLVGVDLAIGADGTDGVLDHARAQGVLIGSTGAASDVLKIRPPLVISAPQIERLACVVADSIHAVADC